MTAPRPDASTTRETAMQHDSGLTRTALALSLLAAPAVDAHEVGGHLTPLLDGLLHPLSGLDHLAAALAVGVWASVCAPRPRWSLPAAFVAAMALAVVAGLAGVLLPAAEIAAVTALTALVTCLMLGARAPMAVGLGAAIAIAVLQGHAHGAGLRVDAAMLPEVLGLLGATATLAAAGLHLGARGGPALQRRLMPVLGTAVAAGALLAWS